jgi:peptidoglycan/LPS O-acetylase OafA/YrhL
MKLTSWPVWSPNPQSECSDEQEIGLLEKDEKGEIELPTDSPRRGFFVRICQCVGAVGVENLKPAWLSKKSESRLHPTSYLDGLRGAASFFVFIHHSSLALFPEIRPGYGASPQPPFPVNHNYLIQLPFLRLVYSGSAMVDIFFVISGAVLSLKPLRLAREGEHLKLIENLSSSAFRRGPRLYIPCFVSTFFTALASLLGFMLRTGISRNYPLSPTRSWTEQFMMWFTSSVQFVRPYAIGTPFEQNLWTIPIEFRGSMMVFLCALGVAKLRSRWMRTLSLVLLNVYWFYLGWWEMFLFLSGMLISEFSLYRTVKPVHHAVIRILHTILFVVAAYLLSMPENGENVAESHHGYSWLWLNFSPASWRRNVEPGRFWPCFGAVLLIAVQSHAGPDSWYQRFFTTRFIQYLGKVSFSFYLWHGLVIYTVGARVMTLMLANVGNEGINWWLSLLVTELAMLPTLFWISDLSTVYVDKAAVRFGKWLMQL